MYDSIENFNRDGFVMLPKLIAPDQVAALATAIDEALTKTQQFKDAEKATPCAA